MDELEADVARAAAGDRQALEAVLAAIEDRVYALALRMLGTRADAEDATQEILLRIARSIAKFRGDAKFTTWVYRVATNFLLTTVKRGGELRELTFDRMAKWLDEGIAANHAPAHDPAVIEEAKLVCAQSMLSCLDRDHRLAFILGEILELPSEEGAAILEISSDAFRQRLSRARRDVDALLRGRCGIADDHATCTCPRQAPHGVASGLIDPARLRLANHPARVHTAQIGELALAARMFRSVPEWRSPRAFASQMKSLLGGIS